MIQKPFDALNEAKDKRVIIELKNGKKYAGILKAFDIHINLVLEEVDELDDDGNMKRKIKRVFVRGDTIIDILVE